MTGAMAEQRAIRRVVWVSLPAFAFGILCLIVVLTPQVAIAKGSEGVSSVLDSVKRAEQGFINHCLASDECTAAYCKFVGLAMRMPPDEIANCVGGISDGEAKAAGGGNASPYQGGFGSTVRPSAGGGVSLFATAQDSKGVSRPDLIKQAEQDFINDCVKGILTSDKCADAYCNFVGLTMRMPPDQIEDCINKIFDEEAENVSSRGFVRVTPPRKALSPIKAAEQKFINDCVNGVLSSTECTVSYCNFVGLVVRMSPDDINDCIRKISAEEAKAAGGGRKASPYRQGFGITPRPSTSRIVPAGSTPSKGKTSKPVYDDTSNDKSAYED